MNENKNADTYFLKASVARSYTRHEGQCCWLPLSLPRIEIRL